MPQLLDVELFAKQSQHPRQKKKKNLRFHGSRHDTVSRLARSFLENVPDISPLPRLKPRARLQARDSPPLVLHNGVCLKDKEWSARAKKGKRPGGEHPKNVSPMAT